MAVTAAPACKSIAVGYVRVGGDDEAHREYLTAQMHSYGTAQGYTVQAVLHDSSQGFGGTSGSGFAELVAEVRARGAAAVIVRSPVDLSADPETRQWMARILRRSGCGLVFLHQPAIGSAPVHRADRAHLPQ